MPIRQTHIWIFGFVIACVLAMSGPLTYTFENTFQQTVDIDRKKQGTVAEATAFDARSAEQPSAPDADRMHELPRIDAARSPTDHFDELPIHLAAFGGGEPSPSGPLPPAPSPIPVSPLFHFSMASTRQFTPVRRYPHRPNRH